MCCFFRFSGFATSEGVVASKGGIVGSPTIASGVGKFIGSSFMRLAHGRWSWLNVVSLTGALFLLHGLFSLLLEYD